MVRHSILTLIGVLFVTTVINTAVVPNTTISTATSLSSSSSSIASTTTVITEELKPTPKSNATALPYVPGTAKSVDIYQSTDGDDDEEEEEREDDDPKFTMETFFTIFVTLIIVLTNCTIIIVAAWTDAFHNFNKVFIYSMSLADLLIGLFVTPYSIFLSVYRRWVFQSVTLCNVVAYIFPALCGAKLFSLTWLNVDHYIAVRKPERYNVMMSKTRSVCWIIISWLAAICFFMPPMLSFKSSLFNKSIFMCQADTKGQIAYILTSIILVSLPAILALLITNIYLFTKSYKKRIRFYEKVFVELSTRPWNYHITFVMCAVQAALWIPYSLFLAIREIVPGGDTSLVEFYLCWLGLCACFCNFFILFLMCSAFRKAVKDMYGMLDWCPHWCCCCRRTRAEYTAGVNVITLTRKR